MHPNNDHNHRDDQNDHNDHNATISKMRRIFVRLPNLLSKVKIFLRKKNKPVENLKSIQD